jgi:hypothetical protein
MVIVVVSVGGVVCRVLVFVLRRRALGSLDSLNATRNVLQLVADTPLASQHKLQQQGRNGGGRLPACHPHRLDLLEQRLRCGTDRAGEADDFDVEVEGVLDGLAALQLAAVQEQTDGAEKVGAAAPSLALDVEQVVEEVHGNAQHLGSSSGSGFGKGELGFLDGVVDSASALARVRNCTRQQAGRGRAGLSASGDECGDRQRQRRGWVSVVVEFSTHWS